MEILMSIQSPGGETGVPPVVVVVTRTSDSRLLAVATAEARRRGCALVVLGRQPCRTTAPLPGRSPRLPALVDPPTTVLDLPAGARRGPAVLEASRRAALLVLSADDRERSWLRLAARTRCPVLLVPLDVAAGREVVVAAFGRPPETAVRVGWEQARLRGRSLVALDTWDVPCSRRGSAAYVQPDPTEVAAVRDAALSRLAQVVATEANEFGEVTVRLQAVRGARAPALAAAAGYADLVILPRSWFARLGGGRRLLRTLLTRARCPVLVCPPWPAVRTVDRPMSLAAGAPPGAVLG
jgi:nucleotide-binding universal stress UspA family protein